MKRSFPFCSLRCVPASCRARRHLSGQFMYIGTLDKKLLVIDEDKEDVVDRDRSSGAFREPRRSRPTRRSCSSSPRRCCSKQSIWRRRR